MAVATPLRNPGYVFVSDSFSDPKEVDENHLPTGAILLESGESLKVEAQGMLASKNLSMKTEFSDKSYWQLFKNYFLGGETVFSNIFTAGEGGGWIVLEETHPHQLMACELSPDTKGIVMVRGAYVASTVNVDLNTKFAGISGMLKGKGMATTLATINPDTVEKTGVVFFNSVNGPIRSICITEDQPVIVDNEALVAYTEGLDCSLIRPGNSTKSLFLSGEGFVCEFKGNGMVFTGSDEIAGRSNALHSAVDLQVEMMQTAAKYLFLGTVLIGLVALVGVKETAKIIKEVLREHARH